MDIEELQDEIDKYDGKVIKGRLSYNPKTIVAAARLVANPNIEQIARRLHNQRIRGVKCYDAFPDECTCMADAKVVAAALTRRHQ